MAAEDSQERGSCAVAQLEAKYEQLKREHPNFAYIQTLGELMSEFVYDSVVTGTGPSADEEQCNSICIFKTLVQEAKNMASNTHLSGYLVEVADNFYNSFLLPVHQSMKQLALTGRAAREQSQRLDELVQNMRLTAAAHKKAMGSFENNPSAPSTSAGKAVRPPGVSARAAAEMLLVLADSAPAHAKRVKHSERTSTSAGSGAGRGEDQATQSPSKDAMAEQMAEQNALIAELRAELAAVGREPPAAAAAGLVMPTETMTLKLLWQVYMGVAGEGRGAPRVGYRGQRPLREVMLAHGGTATGWDPVAAKNYSDKFSIYKPLAILMEQEAEAIRRQSGDRRTLDEAAEQVVQRLHEFCTCRAKLTVTQLAMAVGAARAKRATFNTKRASRGPGCTAAFIEVFNSDSFITKL